MQGRNKQLARLLRVMTLLDRSRRGMKVEDIRRALESRGWKVGLRTVYRDLQALQESGLPIETEPTAEKGARWRLSLNQFTGQLNESHNGSRKRLLALFLVRAAANTCMFPLNTEAQESLFAEIVAELSQAELKYLDELQRVLAFGPVGLNVQAESSPEVFQTLLSACLEQQQVILEVVPNPPTERTTIQVSPYRILISGSRLLLLCARSGSAQVDFVKVKDLRSARMIDMPCEPKPKGDVLLLNQTFILPEQGPCEEISLIVRGSGSELLESLRAGSLISSQPMSNGSRHVRIQAPLTPELARWLLTFGTDVMIESPARLRRSAKQLLEDMLTLMGSDPG